MNPNLSLLKPYPFQRWNEVKKLRRVIPAKGKRSISWSIGEPQHEPPAFVLEEMRNNLGLVAKYPPTKGKGELREVIALWLTRRFGLKERSLDANHHVLPVNGTREALFSFVQALVPGGKDRLIVSPNPFYQIYEGAAFLAGVTPHYLPCRAENNYVPDYEAVAEDIWQRTELLFLCSPGNPTGSVVDLKTLTSLIEKADKYDFVIASDECYSEIYFDESAPPVGLLEACAALGRDDYRRCVVFHSLSKRSNLPGLRSGFVAGDAQILEPYLLYRTYHGCAMPLQTQMASIAAWGDEEHVKLNRAIYREKFDRVLEILGPEMGVKKPDASFYLWAPTPIDDEEFGLRMLSEQNVQALPGRFLSREVDGFNPGLNHIRMALVATLDDCIEAAERIAELVQSL
jgi:N-succinyldiaminopimelate aminotransferase